MEEAKALLEGLTAGIQQTLASKLLGLYLWGSYVVGDFDPRISDVDVVAVLAADLAEEDFAALEVMHDALAERFPAWEGRIEVAYATVVTLDRPAEGGEIVRISPGEPLNRRRSDERWVVDWYVVRERGMALFGPPPAQLLAPISRQKFIESVRANVASRNDLADWAKGPQRQAYAILLLCRALRTTMHGDQLSKPGAGRWAQQVLPHWADLIGRAIAWRDTPELARNGAADDEVRRFVEGVRQRIMSQRY
jgi:predicted nucleotidyltransferase